jgi:predicted transcriptional regulator
METALLPAASCQRAELLKWTSDIVAAYLSRNQMNLKQLPQVMETVYAKLASLGGPDAVIPAGAAAEGTTVAEKSVTPDYIICLEDGVRLKTLKRYLSRKYRMTPEQYRAKWGLPPSYPMVAPNYAAKRSALAKEMGLGRGGKKKPQQALPARAKTRPKTSFRKSGDTRPAKGLPPSASEAPTARRRRM